MQGLWRGLTLALGGLVLGLAVRAAGAAPAPGCQAAELAYVGTESAGLHALRFDACEGRLAAIGLAAPVARPRWLLPHPTLPVLYVAVDGPGEGSVAAYAFDRRSGALTLVNQVTAGGAGTTHLWLDVPSMTLLASNFGGGSVSSLAVNGNGSLGARLSTLQATGSGPHRRQAGPHAHGASIDPSGRHALVADLGADRVFVYGFDRATSALSVDDAASTRAFAAAPGSGPRRAVFGAGGRFVYVLHELTAQVQVLRWDAQQARLAPVQLLPTSSEGFQGTKSASGIAVSADGRFVYVADRGENALLAYRVDPADGTLSLLQRVSSGGESPWAFDLHASGRWMLVAHYRARRVTLLGIDPGSGRLAPTGQSVELPGPWSVAFVN